MEDKLRKRLLAKITCFIILIINIFVISLFQIGCKGKRYEQVTIGDYEYAIVTDLHESPIYWVVDLSKEGKQKEILVYNNLVDNLEVEFGDLIKINTNGRLVMSQLTTQKLKKLMIEKYINMQYSYINKNLINYSNIKYIIHRATFNKINFKTVVNYSLFSAINYESYNNQSTIYMRKNVFEENIADYIEVKKNYSGFDLNKIINYFRPTNLEFHWNYENSPQEDYYWIDDIENGELIEEIPPTPEREGYIFGGWYTEKECINEFSFSTPISKMDIDWEELYNSRQQVPDEYVTSLYAKWIVI